MERRPTRMRWVRLQLPEEYCQASSHIWKLLGPLENDFRPTPIRGRCDPCGCDLRNSARAGSLAEGTTKRNSLSTSWRVRGLLCYRLEVSPDRFGQPECSHL